MTSKEHAPTKLYKFRSLADELSFFRTKEILETGKFWCSRLWDQNDPMEGVYSDPGDESDTQAVFSEKNDYVICSFSRPEALQEPSIWGYYANGFKGVAIEVEIERSAEFVDVHYQENPPTFGAGDLDKQIRAIATTKLKNWSTECETRFLKKAEPSKIEIGIIKAIYFGKPYGNVSNQGHVVSRVAWKAYQGWRDELLGLARHKKLDCFDASVRGHNDGDYQVRFDPIS